MFKMENNIAVLGLGKTAQSMLQFLKAKGLSATVFCDQLSEDNRVFMESYQDFNLKQGRPESGQFNSILASPGFPFPELEKSYPMAMISGDLPLLMCFVQAKNSIFCTGTNGKSTVVDLMDGLLSEGQAESFTGGNIGLPMLDGLKERDFQRLIFNLELSSYQLASLKSHGQISNGAAFRPKIFLLTNLQEDHLGWHGNLDSYHREKLKFLSLDPERYCPENFIYREKDHLRIEQLIGKFDLKGMNRVIVPEPGFSNRSFDLRDSRKIIFYPEKNKLIEIDIPEDSGFFSLSHNIQNTAFAIAAASLMDLSSRQIAKALKAYKPLPYRMEYVDRIGGVNCFNDSKSTTIASTISGAGSLKDDFILLVGGMYKGDSAKEALTFKCKEVFAFGKDGKKIARVLGFENASYFEDLASAIIKAKTVCKEKGIDNLVVSPAGASFDAFKNFEERGQFIDKVLRGDNE